MSTPLNHDFEPSIWMRNKHIQSCFHVLFPSRVDNNLMWEQLDLPDGDFVDLCWTGNPSGPIAVLLHGIEGSYKSHYIQHMIKTLQEANWQVVVFHFRSCSGRMNRIPQTYHGGFTQDFEYVLSVLRQRFPTRILVAIGFSLGGSILLNHLARRPDSPLAAAVSVSTPFDLGRCADDITSLYRRPIIKSLKEKFIAKKLAGQDVPASIEELKAVEDFQTFDNLLTAPLYGFRDAHDYYRAASVKPMLKKIHQSTLLIHSIDDPMVPMDSIPDPSDLSSSTLFDLHRFGGHVGFIDHRLPWRVDRWFTRRILDFLRKSV